MSEVGHFSGPWLPWFHGDFLKSTQGWTVTERGVYFLLLGASWEIGPLPNDRRRLAGIVSAQLDEFEEAWKVVHLKFLSTDAGLVNRRLEVHRKKQAERSEKARQSANMRHHPDREPDANAHADASANGGASAMLEPMLEGMRSGCSSELRAQNSEKGKSLTAAAAAGRTPAAFHDEVIAAYLKILPNQPRVKGWSKERARLLNARIAERCKDGKPADGIAYWRDFFNQVAASDFLMHKSTTNISLGWLLKPENFLKVIEGNYDNRSSPRNGAARPSP